MKRKKFVRFFFFSSLRFSGVRCSLCRNISPLPLLLYAQFVIAIWLGSDAIVAQFARDSRSNVYLHKLAIFTLFFFSSFRVVLSSPPPPPSFAVSFVILLHFTLYIFFLFILLALLLLYPHIFRIIERDRENVLIFFYGCFLNTKHLHFKHSNTLFITLSYFLDKMRVCVVLCVPLLCAWGADEFSGKS